MKLYKRASENPPANSQSATGHGVDRREFLRRSGLAVGGAALAGSVPLTMMQKAEATGPDAPKPAGEIKQVKSVCTHCSVGCGVVAEVQNGVWIGQEPAFDHPFNLGAHCAKGASVREHGHGERRLKYPMKLVAGKWQRITWDQAINELGDQLLGIRDRYGPDSVYFVGSSKHNNEQAYLLRKFAALWGSNNIDHQARICHSTTVAGVANTWGYGAMTNSYNDIHNSKAILIIGGNPAEAHPVSMQHIFRAKERGAPLIVVDPRMTRTAAHADLHIRIRPGTDVPFVWGMLWHVFKNGWEDRTFIEQRVFGLEEVRKEVAKWTPAEVEKVAGVPEEAVFRAARIMAENRPGTFIWCMGGTQHTIGNNNTRAYCIFQLALGNLGVEGGGTNVFRGHDNVQGATDVGPNADSLPAYYGLEEGAWRHWAKVWDVDYDWLAGRFDQGEYDDGAGKRVKPMFNNGIPVSRWIDGVLEAGENIAQKNPIKAVVFWGHAPNSQVRGPEMKAAFEKLEVLAIIDPYPTVSAVMHDRTDNVYLLPATTQFETYGSLTSSNRSLQWRSQIIEPLFESRVDHKIMYQFARKFGFEQELCKHIKVENDTPLIEDILREINRGAWAAGYTGQSPERLKLHQEHWHTFHTTTLKAQGGPCDGEYYGLPWPCWGTPELKHPGSHVLYDTSKTIAEGGSPFRARFGTEYQGQNLLAKGSFTKGSEIQDGYPEFSADLLKKLNWWNDLTEAEKALAEGKNWKTDLSGGIIRVAIRHGCAPFGNAKARCIVWNFPDPVPVHREPLYTPRRDLVTQYPTYQDRKRYWRLPTRYASIQQQDFSAEFPLIMTSGRLVEYEGGGDETRSNPWLAELQQEMFIEINPRDANNAGIGHGESCWVAGPEGGRIRVMAFVTERVRPGVVFMPFHFGGRFEGEDLRGKYPEGAAPYVLGESCNLVFTYGYDSVTAMQETKVSLCRVEVDWVEEKDAG
jgi:formate dehydrogenase major subunit